MSDIDLNSNPPPELRPYHVLVTGFGPFSRYSVNPSWLAVKPLHNTILRVDIPLEPVLPVDQPLTDSQVPLTAGREIRITAIQVPVTYEAVLSTVPGLHARPPILPPTSDPFLPTPLPPPEGYDLFFHVGVIGRGSLRMERVGHKFGYNMKDAAGSLAPIVRVFRDDASQPPDAQRMEVSRLRDARDYIVESPVDSNETPKRGFGRGYESYSEEIYTDIDVEKLVHHLKTCGFDQIYTSMDAGHYICDFLYYCSLAESKRSAKNDKSTPASQVLFLHCPPVGLPLSTEEVTEAIRKSIMWLCKAPTQ
ncbi:hypothetical protein EDC04DRAFT_2558476 [Pisolithus marmoratus]|nr:hypothetical protein EDC04DRAFT_2558476 [Pisolithus marmoratus]